MNDISMTDFLDTTLLPAINSYQDMSGFNTMALTCKAERLIHLTKLCDVEPTFQQLAALNQAYVVISNGSNIILPEMLHATVVFPSLKGMTVLGQDATSITVEVMAGENWHNLVVETVNNGWYGLENLALIPSWVGGSPVQNIGAYGVQVEDVIASVKAFHIPTLTWHHLSKAECEFSYRDSVFKRQAGQWLITSVIFTLSKIANTNTQYGDVAKVAQQYALQAGRDRVTPIDTMNAIIEIRQSKLPDTNDLPNCGSFFKNPIIAKSHVDQLLTTYPNLVHYPLKDATGNATEQVKVAAGWLIDQAGLKGQGIAPILTHTKQALVLTNHAPTVATQTDVANSMQFIQKTVFEKFGIRLEAEPVWIESDGSIRQSH